MPPVFGRPPGSVIGAAFRGLAFGGLLLCLWCVTWSGQASPPDCPPTFPSLLPPVPDRGQASPEDCPPTCPPLLPPVPEKGPRPATGPDSVGSFIDSLSSNDAAFEVLVGQGRILTLKESLAARGRIQPLIAVGDPTVIDVTVVSPRQFRVLGMRMGVTDLSITTADGRSYNFEVRVVADLDVLRARLRCLFPDASLKLAALRDHVVVEGQARDTAQVAHILETIRAYLLSVQIAQARQVRGGTGGAAGERPPEAPKPDDPKAPELVPPPRAEGDGIVSPDRAAPLQVTGTITPPQVINLIRVPGSQQVLLKVRVAELNRTAMRQIGADFLVVDPDTGVALGTQIGGATIQAVGNVPGRPLRGGAVSNQTTVFGIFDPAHFQFFLSALRRNALLKILAEPNLVALNGHQANFLAGGSFPVPVPQVGASGVAPTITVQFQPFGVQLGFTPFILDGDVIRLTVDPEVSSIDFSIGTTLVAGGSVVPGLNTRKAHTVVEMRQGQTLAIAGLLQLTVDGNTSRIPGLGDLPILGPFFSNTTSDRIEKELIVFVTPYLVEPMNADQVGPAPGDEVNAPNDLEFYLLNRIQGRTGRDFRATTEYDDATHLLRALLKLHNENVRGPSGFCD